MQVGTLTLKRWLAVDNVRDDFAPLLVRNGGRNGSGFGDGNMLQS